MVVTDSLARGLLRETIARQSVQCSKVWRRARQAGLHAPPSLRRFREWFASHWVGAAWASRDAAEGASAGRLFRPNPRDACHALSTRGFKGEPPRNDDA